MTNDQFNNIYLPRYDATLKRLARKLARRDQVLYEELYQTGMIALWQLDTSKATENEDAWIRQALKYKMVSLLRTQRPKLFEALEKLLETNQLVYDPDAEAPRLVKTPRWRQDEENGRD